MKRIPFTVAALLPLVIVFTACRHSHRETDIPDIHNTFRNISYLDSAVRAKQVDSIAKLSEDIDFTIRTYTNRAFTPEDKVTLDSLSKISSVAHDFLNFCNDTHINLEELEQDTRMLENNYKSGKTDISAYISTLLQDEQVLVDLSNQYIAKYQIAKAYLKSRSMLVSRFKPPEPSQE
jgi:hypothetical protein